ncbi:MAG: radical SAM protein [Chloroflexi bacterium]|nr:radical SAM protein [Chloroflexota bacterium]
MSAAQRAGSSAAPVLLLSGYELGHQPLGVAAPLAWLAAAGIAAQAVDLAQEPLAQHAQAVRSARWVGISTPMHTALRVGVQAARDVRALNPAAHISFYGHYAALNAPQLLRADADSVLAGELQSVLPQLAHAVLQGTWDGHAPPPGVRTAHCPDAALPIRRTAANLQPQRAGLQALQCYAQLRSNGRLQLAGYTEATRGCKHMCTHCPIPPVYGGRFVAVPVAAVLADVHAQVAAGARHITFGDPDFLNGPAHALRIARTLHQQLPHVTFDFTAKVSHIAANAGLFAEFAALGCLFVVSAVESLAAPVLQALRKGHTRAELELALRTLDAAGIALRISLVAFTPWTTLADYLEQLAWLRANDLVEHIDAVQLGIRLLIPPGSLLLREFGNAVWLGALDAENYCHPWTHPDARMDALWAQVSDCTAAAARTGEDARTTFAAVERLAYAAAGRVAPAPGPRLRPPPPGLTESWFC